MAKCRDCGEEFEKTAKMSKNRIYCDACSVFHGNPGALYLGAFQRAAERIKAELDAQVTVWTSDRYSQEFLRGLIPR